jgi:hypothetical protein
VEQRRSLDTKSVKAPALPEDDLAHFEALVDRMLRDRAAAGFPARGAPVPLAEVPRITIGHPAGLVEERNAMQQQQKPRPKEQRVEVLRAFFFKGEVLEVGSKPVLPYYFALEMTSANKAKFVDDEPSPPPPPAAEAKPAAPSPAATAAQVADRRREPPASVVARPWHVRHARKLIGTAVLAVGAGTAYLAYTNAWRFAPEQASRAAPAAPEPAGPVERPITPAPPPVAQPPASATVRSAAVPAPTPTAATAVSRPPAVTHTLRETAPVPLSAAAAPAVVPAPQPAAAPSDCPESIAALGLCTSRMSKAAK